MLRSESLRLLVIMVLLLAHSRGNGLWCLAANPVSKIVGRTTNDRDADLLRALIGLGRFDDALDFCRWQSVDLDRSSDEAAKWEIRKSEVLMARQMGSDAFGDLEFGRRFSGRVFTEAIAFESGYTQTVDCFLPFAATDVLKWFYAFQNSVLRATVTIYATISVTGTLANLCEKESIEKIDR